MTTITVTLADEIARQLEAAKANARLTTDEIVQRALSRYFRERADEGEDALVGMFDFGDENFAERSEDILHSLTKDRGAWTTKE
jgi:hypothetical protein